ncbi:hypothetical protein [Ancylobacter sp. SL191]|uniref:hypothetical protein n=1 Tax=Ancylobacter sp. SL191 TaxID=2995166 RepID=UPI00226D94D1|nr:hypothetical protein [Ancylobacter sp. SL191]WAC25754.1 hypothetical protein OU996_12005 [Ancylobacter sp. SL191]
MGTHVREHPNSVRRFELIETTALRRRMERAVEALLAALDDMDGDPDIEEDDPPEDGHDAEDNRDDLEPDADGEPAVGWVTNEQGSFYRGERI